MSAPSGYNADASMLPSTSGTIHAMSGGSMTSPYSGGISADTSLLRAPPASPGDITNYRGGGPLNNAAVAIAATNATAATTSATTAATTAATTSAVPIATTSAMTSTIPVATTSDIASSANGSIPANGSRPIIPVPHILSDDALAAVAIATSAATSAVTSPIASSSIPESDLIEQIPSNSVSAMPSATISPVSATTSQPESSAITSATDPFAIAAVAAVSIKKVTDESDESDKSDVINESNMEERGALKTIIVYGKKYDVADPDADDNDGWKKLLKKLRFDVFRGDKKKKIKRMIYDQPTCLEHDLPISSLITCDPMRNIIRMISLELLHSGYMDDSSKSKVNITFDPEKQIKALSETKFQMMIPTEKTETTEVTAPTAGGTRKARKRRIIRQHA